MRLYLGCVEDHAPPQDVDAPGVRAAIVRGGCPVCPGEFLEASVGTGGWARCACCGSSWKLEEDGFGCRPGRLVEEFE